MAEQAVSAYSVRMMKLRDLLIVGILLALNACAAGPSLGPQPPGSNPAVGAPSADVFRPEDFAWSTAMGKGGIEGHLGFSFDGVRYTCKGAGVILTPETLWSRRRISALYNSPISSALPVDEVRARTATAPSGDYSAFIRRATCDGGDRFTFSTLPNGAWFVILVAKPLGGKGTDMAIMKRVEVRGGRVVLVEL
ncbi:MAG: hypothetical protein CGW95_10900 [Phenylobacterium zucineum]|nr:MAG: hypothetical protein CGW95_10900 [Phenylobacterium zucineum]